MKKLLLPFVILAVLLGATDTWAKPAKPVVVTSFAGYDALMNDVKFLGKLSDTPELAITVDFVVKMATKGKGLAGLDTARPWGGAILPKKDGNYEGYGFLPVKDLKKLVEVVKPLVQSVEELDNGAFKLTTEDGEVAYIREKGGWAFIAAGVEVLGNVPADPLTILGGLEKEYDLAVRFNLGNVPTAMRDEFLAGIKTGIEEGLREQPELKESKALKKAVEGFSKHTFEFFKVLIDELDHVTLGWSLDQKMEKIVMDAVIVAKKETELARSVDALEKATSDFGGFLVPGAAMTARISGTAPKSKIAAVEGLVDIFRVAALQAAAEETDGETEKKILQKLLNDFSDVIEKTVQSAKIDGAVSLLLEKKSLTMIAGGYVADGYALEKLMKDMIEIAKEEGEEDVDLIKLDADKLKGVRFHTVSVPLDEEDDEDLKKLFGKTLDVAVGFGKQSVYLAAGRNALDSLKRAIRESALQTSEVVPPLRASISVASICEFVARVGETEEERWEAAKVAELLADSPGKDHVTLTARPISNGVHYRLEVEPGLLRMFGRMVAEAKEEEEQ